MGQVGGHAQWRSSSDASTLQLSRIYLTTTVGGMLTFSTVGPMEAGIEEAGDGVWAPTDPITGQRLFKTTDDRLTAYGG